MRARRHAADHMNGWPRPDQIPRMKELGMEHLYVEIAGGDHSRFINQSEEVVGMLFDFFNIVAKTH